MKIVQVIPYFCFGGAETMCENLTYALRNLGHTVVVVSLYDRPTPISRRMEEAGVVIRFLDKKPGMDVSMVPKLRALFREEKPDVVHTHLDTIKYAVAAARLAGIKNCVHTVHNVAEKEAEGPVQKAINGLYFSLGWSVPVALSPLVQRTIRDFYHMGENRIPVVYNGVDLSRCEVKTDYALSQPPILLHIGRFTPQKNHAGLLRAFCRIRSAFPQCRLRLVGDGELLEDTRALARSLGVEEWVDFLGSRENVHPILKEADVFLLPSEFEGMPMTLIEAMGSALPIAAARVGGVPDMLTDGESALLTDCADAAVAEACIRLLSDQELRRRLGQNALAASARFSSEHMARSYENLYQPRTKGE